MKLTKLFKEFFENERTGGIILIVVTALSLFLTNSSISSSYLAVWNFDIGGHPLEYWINDGLMTIFFLFVGIELKRELYIGELSSLKKATLPVVGALGGMIAPACIYFLFNHGTPELSGAGIPTATDIAFAIGILSLLGNRVPASLKVFLTALAVIDDLGAIVVIGLFYSSSIAFSNLFIALGIWGLLFIIKLLKVRNLIPYLIGGGLMWYFMLHSGVHATITGVLLALTIPFNKNGEQSPSSILEHVLNKPVVFFILPLFAMANTCLIIDNGWTNSFSSHSSLGIIFGLIVGKPIGITLFAFIFTMIGICEIPSDLKWKNILGAGMLGGIGFTMAIFVTLLAFNDPLVISHSKMAILAGSISSGILGYTFLRLTMNQTVKPELVDEY
jgi:NhaA family Na+:H+ antiporter